MPLVVPQLKTITLGGAVAGLGIESTSFRHGLPHESVRRMEILTGAGEVVTATPDGEHADLYRGFPNSYGTLGYALRLVIDLQPVAPCGCTTAAIPTRRRAPRRSSSCPLPRSTSSTAPSSTPTSSTSTASSSSAPRQQHRERLHGAADLLLLAAAAGRPPDRP